MKYHIGKDATVEVQGADEYLWHNIPTGQKRVLDFKLSCAAMRMYGTRLEKNFRADKQVIQDIERQGFKMEAHAVRVVNGQSNKTEFRYSIVGRKTH